MGAAREGVCWPRVPAKCATGGFLGRPVRAGRSQTGPAEFGLLRNTAAVLPSL